MHVCICEDSNYKSVSVEYNTTLTIVSVKLSQMLKTVVVWNEISDKY